jgi:hypothetical protein
LAGSFPADARVSAASRTVRRWLALVVAVLTCTWPAQAGADWLVVPFIGNTFAPETTFLTFEEGAGRKLTLGASVALLSDGLLGVEAEVGHIPRFFEGNDPLGLVTESRVTTLSGSVVLAAPLAVTRESLRPYLVGGLGLMQARSRNAVGFFPVTQDLLALNLGGGAIGFLSPRTGVRFDLRQFKAVTGEDGPFARSGVSRLSFWRLTIGVVLRY